MILFSLLKFEVKRQFRNPIFLCVSLILIVFSYFEFSVFLNHYPMQNEQDIQAIMSTGKQEFLYIQRNEQEAKVVFDNKMSTLSVEDFGGNSQNYQIVQQWYSKNYKQNMNLDQAFSDFVEHVQSARLRDFVNQKVQDSKTSIGSVEQVNSNLLKTLGQRPLTYKISQIFADRMQVIGSILAIPLFCFLFAEDKRIKAADLVKVKPLENIRFVLSKFGGSYLALLILISSIGILINLWFCLKLHRYGWDFNIFDMVSAIFIFIAPSLLFLSLLLIFVSLFLNNEFAAVPVGLIYVLLNVRIQSFAKSANSSINIYQYMIRNDDGIHTYSITDLLIHRFVFLTIAILLFALILKLWNTKRKSLR